jgi:hypothetical protein
MTVSATTCRVTYPGTGTNGPFPFTFQLLQAADLGVEIEVIASPGTITSLVLTTDFAITGVGFTSGGSITTTAVIPVGTSITLFRNPAIVQPDVYQDQAAYDAAAVMKSLDRTVMEVQAVQDRVSRAALLPGIEAGTNFRFPAASMRKGLFYGFSPVDGSPGAFSGGSSTPISAAMVAVVTAASLGAARIAFGDILAEQNTVAALKALATIDLTGGQLVRGYYAAGDGGGGVYYWNATDATADNGGTVIIPNSAPGTGRWNLLYTGLLSLRCFGAKGDGATSDAAAAQAWLNVGGELYVPNGSFFLPLNTLLSVTSNTHISGPGKFIGPAVAVQGVPTAYIQINGSVGAGTAFGSAIAVGVKSFAVANTFAANDLLMLSNFPTDATDAYTEGGADIFGRKARSYANTSAANLRQTRRKEILEVLSGGNPFVTQSGTALAYPSTVALQFQKITPAANVRFTGVTFENIYLFSQYSRGLTFDRCYAYSCLMQAITCYAATLDFVEWDARNGNCFLDVLESSKGTTIRGTYRGLNCTSDNGMVKMDQLFDTNVDVVVEGVRVSNAVMLDTNFGNNPTGYTDVPSLNFNFKVICRDANAYSCVSLSNDPYCSQLSYGQVHVSSDGAGLLVKGCDHVDVFATLNYQDGSGYSINVLGSNDISLYGQWKGNIFQSTVTDPRTAAVLSNARISSITGPQLLAKQPSFSAFMNAAVANVTGDGTNYTPTFTSIFDRASNYNSGTGVFTAPVTGIYSFNINVRGTSLGAAHTSGWMALVTTGRTYYSEPNWGALRDSANATTISMSVLADMTAGDTASVQFKVIGGTKTVGIAGGGGIFESFFMGRLEA